MVIRQKNRAKEKVTVEGSCKRSNIKKEYNETKKGKRGY